MTGQYANLPTAVEPYATTRNTSTAAATSLTLQGQTKMIEVKAKTGDVFFLWGSGTCSTTSGTFSSQVFAGETVHRYVPDDVTQVSYIGIDSAEATIIES